MIRATDTPRSISFRIFVPSIARSALRCTGRSTLLQQPTSTSTSTSTTTSSLSCHDGASKEFIDRLRSDGRGEHRLGSNYKRLKTREDYGVTAELEIISIM